MEGRNNAEYAQNLLRNVEETKDESIWCKSCWLLHTHCICTQVQQLSPALSLGPHKLLIYMHYKEYRRSSNSAVLLQKLIPGQSKIVLFGTEEGTNEFNAELADSRYRSCVLFPSDNSMALTEWTSRSPGEPVQLIALDGTWKQCKRMSKCLPKTLPLVRLDPDTPSLFRSRKQTARNRLSTLEAVALAWKLIGVDVADTLMEAFVLKDKAGLSQRHRPYDGPS